MPPAACAVTIEPSTATPSVAPTWRPALWIADAMPVRVAATAATAVAVVAGSAIPAPAPSASSAGHRPAVPWSAPTRLSSERSARGAQQAERRSACARERAR